MAVLYVGGSAVSPDPYEYTYGLMDVSSDDAGRVMDASATMYKQRICQKRKLQVKWRMLTDAQISAILTAFNPEYVDVTYHDAMNNAMETRTFYVGDRSAPLKWYQTLDGTRWAELSFDLIER